MARALSLAGAALPKNLMAAAPSNPRGFWESQEIRDFNDEVLKAFDSEWDDFFAGRPQHYLSNFDRVFSQRATELLENIFGMEDFVVLKDPRINVLTAFWNRALRAAGFQPTYVIMVRHPMEVAASLRERDAFSTEKALLLWLDNMLAAERDTRGSLRVFVAYKDLLINSRRALDRIEAAAGHPLPRRTSANQNAIEQFLTSSLRNQNLGDAEIAGDSVLSALVAKVYAWFEAAAADAEQDNTAPLAEANEYLKSLSENLGPVLADFRSKIAEYRRHAEGLQHNLNKLRNEVDAELALAKEKFEADLVTARQDFAAELETLTQARNAEEARVAQVGHELDALKAAAAGESEALKAALLTSETRASKALEQLESDQLAWTIERNELQTRLETEQRTYLSDREDLLAQIKAVRQRLDQTEAAQSAAAQAWTAERASLIARVESEQKRSEADRQDLLVQVDALRRKLDQVEGARRAESEAWASERAAQQMLIEGEQERFQLERDEISAAAAAAARKLDEVAASRASDLQLWNAEREGLLSQLRDKAREIDSARETAMASMREAVASAFEPVRLLEMRQRELQDEIFRLQTVSEALLVENRELKRDASLRSGDQSDADAAANALLTARAMNAETRVQSLEIENGVLEERARELKAEILRLVALNESAFVPRGLFETTSSELQVLRTKVENLESERQSTQALLLEREAIINSTSWKMTAVPRNVLSLLKRK